MLLLLVAVARLAARELVGLAVVTASLVAAVTWAVPHIVTVTSALVALSLTPRALPLTIEAVTCNDDATGSLSHDTLGFRCHIQLSL